MPESEWFAVIAGEKAGPFPGGDLLTRRDLGEISDRTLVWRAGMADWTPLARSALVAVPPAEAVDFLGAIGRGLVRCAVSGEWRPESEMLPYGDSWIAPEHKEAFLQGLREGRQPASLSWGGYFYRDAGRLASVTWWLVVVSTVLGSLITAATVVAALATESESAAGSSPGWIAVNASFSCLYLIAFAANALWFCLWTHRVAANALAFGASWIRVSPGWAVGWHFVPIASLWMPYLAMSDISRASLSPETGESAGTPSIVKSWWALWVGSNAISLVSGVVSAFGLETEALLLAAAYLPLGIAAAWAVCRMMTFVTEAQRAVASSDQFAVSPPASS